VEASANKDISIFLLAAKLADYHYSKEYDAPGETDHKL